MEEIEIALIFRNKWKFVSDFIFRNGGSIIIIFPIFYSQRLWALNEKRTKSSQGVKCGHWGSRLGLKKLNKRQLMGY